MDIAKSREDIPLECIVPSKMNHLTEKMNDEDSTDDEDDDNNNNNNNNNMSSDVGAEESGISQYELLRLRRIERNQARLQELGLLENNMKPKRLSQQQQRRRSKRDESLEPVRQQPSRHVKTNEDEKSYLGKQQRSNNHWRCGDCEGCNRAEDCELTCVYCVERKMEEEHPTGKLRRRCLFKSCRRRQRRSSSGIPKEPVAKVVEASVHTRQQELQLKEPPSVCDVCKQENYLIVCSNCQKGYHSNCHVPKIRYLPLPNDDDDEWLCMDCHPRSAHSNTSKGWLWAVVPIATDNNPSSSCLDSSFATSNEKFKLIKLKIAEPSPTCTVCMVDCLEKQMALQCKACDHYYHLACHDPPLDVKPKGGGLYYWKCKTCQQDNREMLEHHQRPKQVRSTTKKKKQKKTNHKFNLFNGEHDDDCYICYNGGDLICCDFCEKVFHMACHVPPLPAMPAGLWKCCECYASENTEMTRCGDCPACWADEECPYPSYAETYVPGKIPGEIIQEEIDENDSKTNTSKRKRNSVEREKYDEETSQDEDGPVIINIEVPKLMDPVSIKVRKIINNSRRAQMDSKVQDKACELLRKLATSSENVDKIILAGGVEMIASAMSKHVDKSVLQAEACATIAAMAWLDASVAVKIAHMGVVQRIIQCMEDFPVNAKVQQMGCGAFRALSYEGSDIVFINNVYGIAAVLNSIKRNPRKLSVHKEACFFLQNMFVQSPEAVAEKTLHAQVLCTLLQSLCREEADVDLKLTILKIIAHLALEKKAAESMSENDAVISSVVAVLLNPNNGVTVKHAACGTLQLISASSLDNKNKILEAGGVAAAVAAVNTLPDNVGMIESAFGLIKELFLAADSNGEDAAAKWFIADHNGKNILLSAMIEHSDNSTVQMAACGVIAYIPFEKSDDTDKDVALAHAILRAMKNHPNSAVVQIAAVEALLELATHLASVRKLLLLKDNSAQELLLHAKSIARACTTDVDDLLAIF